VLSVHSHDLMPAATRYYKETLLLVIDQTRVVPDSRTWLSVHRLRDVSLRDSARTPTGGKGSFLFLTFPVTKNRTPLHSRVTVLNNKMLARNT